jgi:UDP-glucose 4-epimerase
MRALCVGGGGFLGSHITDLLISKGVETYVLKSGFRSNNHPNFINKDATIIEGNLLNLADLEAATKGIDYVYHFGAIASHYCDVYPELAFDVNIKGTWNLKQACVKNKVKRILYPSTSFVYGNTKTCPIHENVPLEPKDGYGISKMAAEKILKADYPIKMSYTILRLFNVYGPRSYPDRLYSQAITTFILLALQGKSIEIHDEGIQELDFIYVKDVAEAFWQCLKPEAENKIFNVGSGKTESINSLVNEINQLTGNKAKPHHNSAHPAYFNKFQADIERIKEYVGWTPKIQLTEGLKETIEFFKTAPKQ